MTRLSDIKGRGLCKYCGKEFISNRRLAITCDDCKILVRGKSSIEKRLIERCGFSILKVLSSLGDKCEICGYKHCLEMHHINKNRKDNSLSNLMMLCPNCHVLIHRKRKTIAQIKDLVKKDKKI